MKLELPKHESLLPWCNKKIHFVVRVGLDFVAICRRARVAHNKTATPGQERCEQCVAVLKETNAHRRMSLDPKLCGIEEYWKNNPVTIEEVMGISP